MLFIANQSCHVFVVYDSSGLSSPLLYVVRYVKYRPVQYHILLKSDQYFATWQVQIVGSSTSTYSLFIKQCIKFGRPTKWMLMVFLLYSLPNVCIKQFVSVHSFLFTIQLYEHFSYCLPPYTFHNEWPKTTFLGSKNLTRWLVSIIEGLNPSPKLRSYYLLI